MQNGAGALVTQSMEKAEVSNAFITSVFTRNNGLSGISGPESRTKGWNKEDVSLVEKDQVSKYLNKLDMWTYIPWTLMGYTHKYLHMEMTDINMRPLSRIFEYS